MGRILGIDYGDTRVGIAISDERQIVATPLTTLPNQKSFALDLELLLKSYGSVDKIIIGLPLEMSGKEGSMAQKVRLFAQNIQESLHLPIDFWDERLTSALVEKTLVSLGFSRKKRAKKSDVLAATIILQSYLDRVGS